MWNHLVFRSREHTSHFARENICRETWSFFRENCKDILALILMPNHLHLATTQDYSEELIIELRRQLNRSFGLRVQDWDIIPAPEKITDLIKLKRTIRYIHLNSCRSKLTRDPLAWKWSTHRDWLGYSDSPLLSLSSCPSLKSWRRDQFHYYVNADPTVDVQGTLLPQADLTPFGLSEEGLKQKIECYFRLPFDDLLKPRNPIKQQLVPLVAQSLEMKTATASELFHLTPRQIQKYLQCLIAQPTAMQRFREFVCDPRF
ncbi:MAG: hypothetical protein KA715_08950 [Xanthomonadaceae bacterium]|nr:hypothetical protein [Xanthomonadaceae bacterium]